MLTPVPPTECMRAREAVSARLDGELSELEGARLEQHLRGCASCRAFAGEAEAVTLRLRAADLEPLPAQLFVPQRRRRLAPPLAAAAASLLVAAATGSSFLVGQLLGARSGHAPAPATTATSTGLDPGILAMLHDSRSGRVQTGRVIAL